MTDPNTRDYPYVLDWIYSFVNLEASRTPHLARDSMHLEKIAHLLRALGDPQAGQEAVHIAGSKGKGSLAYLLAGWFTARGVRTGLYTSPHILDVRERIQVDRAPISEAGLLGLAAELRAVVERTADPALRPTFFDLFTAMAFAWFRRQGARLWIVETGMGGRLDSTNVLHPLLSVITSISLEHTEILGATLRQIAREKGGIIKPGTPVVVSRNPARVVEVLREIARERQAPFWYLPEHLSWRPAGYVRGADGRLLQRVKAGGATLETSLLGLYQAENIALFLLALRVLAGLRPELGPDPLAPRPSPALSFLRELDWPGRLTWRRVDDTDLLVDGAHNAESARYLRDTVLRMRRDGALPDRPLVGVIGMFAEKDHAGILKPLLPLLRHVYFIEPDSYRDSRVERYLPVFRRLNAALAEPVGHTVVGPVGGEPRWLERVLADARGRLPGGFSVLGTGSLYTAAAILKELRG